MPVHHIDVNHGSAARGSLLDLVRQMSKIRRKNRGCEFDELPSQIRVQDVGSKLWKF
jgi:hypothetical protein